MTRATLAEVLRPALADGYAVAGFVCQGWEDSRAYVEAAETEGAAVILQAGPGCRAHTPMPVLGAMFRTLADGASVPVVTHLDHGASLEECQVAISEGFSSVMYDGSRLSLAQNIENTAEVARAAQAAGVSSEGEIGFVGYESGRASEGTDPKEAQTFVAETGIDAVAVSVGNLHLQENQQGRIDEERLRAIEALVDIPLVIHGGSGIGHDDRRRLSQTSAICKFNIGTEVRMAYGRTLRRTLAENGEIYDRIEIMNATYPTIVELAAQIIAGLR